MPIGPGKYDSLCTYVREHAPAQADAVIVLVISERDPTISGFSVQTRDPSLAMSLPGLLRDLANSIEKDTRTIASRRTDA